MMPRALQGSPLDLTQEVGKGSPNTPLPCTVFFMQSWDSHWWQQHLSKGGPQKAKILM